MQKKLPIFDYDLCIACGICTQECPITSLILGKTDLDAYKKAYPVLSDRSCIGCALCEKACPMGAIRMEETK